MATEIKANVLKVKPNQDGSSKGKAVLPVYKKKIEGSSSRPIADSKHKSIITVSKSEAREKTTSSSSVMKAREKTTSSSSKTVIKTAAVKVKSQKKVYTLAGQKYDPPEEREPLRIFYESLSKQIPSSEMAEFWMMEHGLLSPDRAKKAYERKQKRQQQIRMGTPIKPLTKPESSQKHQASKNGDFKAKKRVISGSDDYDFIVKRKKVKA